MASIGCIDVASVFGGGMAFARISSLTKPLPNETIFSWIARLGMLSGLATDQDFLLVRFGYSGQQLTSQFPGFLNQLSETTGLAAQDLIDNHSVLPMLRPFVQHDVFEQACESLSHGEDASAYSKFSFLANRIPQPVHLNYCPVCLTHDLKAYGVAYWHVTHQLPWIDVCYKHGVQLNQVRRQRKQLVLPPQYIELKPSDLHRASPKRIHLARDMVLLWLLNLKHLNGREMQKVYLHGLNLNGLITVQGSVRQELWRASLVEYWAQELPSELNDAIFAGHINKSYPANLIYQPDSQFHPLKHLLAIQPLLGRMGAFLRCYSKADKLILTPEIDKKPQIERVSSEATRVLIKQLKNGLSLRQAAKRAKVSVGYAKTIAIQNGIEIKRRAQFIFEKERTQILRMLKSGKSTAFIAKEIQCSRGAIEQLLTQFPDVKALRVNLRFEDRRNKQRNSIKDCISRLETPTRAQVQKLKRSAYTWLFKHDQVWLYQVMPETIPRNQRNRK